MDGLAAARARGRTGGQKPKLGPRQVRLARQMYDELDDGGKRKYTVAQIADEFGVTRPHDLPPPRQANSLTSAYRANRCFFGVCYREAQLADRYLAGPVGIEGIYVVGYFHGESWEPTDKDQRRTAYKHSIDELRARLEGEARAATEKRQDRPCARAQHPARPGSAARGFLVFCHPTGTTPGGVTPPPAATRRRAGSTWLASDP